MALTEIKRCTINLEGLLRTKQTMRNKDVADGVVLERALKMLKSS